MSRSPSPLLLRREQLTNQIIDRLRAVRSPDERREVLAELIETNLPLCDALAARYAGRGAELDDLVQVARAALVAAAERFRPAEGMSFAAFAVPTITGELKRHFRDRCWVVRPPRHLQELRALATSTQRDLEQSLGRAVTSSELSERLGVTRSDVEESINAQYGYRPASLDAPAAGNASASLGSLLGDGHDLAEEVTQRINLRKALTLLSPRDRLIVAWRFVEERTQSEIAARLGVSQMQVSRIIRRILRQLRAFMGADVPALLASAEDAAPMEPVA